MEAFNPIMFGGIHTDRRTHKSHPLALLKVCSFDYVNKGTGKDFPKEKCRGVIQIFNKDS